MAEKRREMKEKMEREAELERQKQVNWFSKKEDLLTCKGVCAISFQFYWDFFDDFGTFAIVLCIIWKVFIIHILPILKVNSKNRYKLQYSHQGSHMNRQVKNVGTIQKSSWPFEKMPLFFLTMLKQLILGLKKKFYYNHFS